MRSRNLLTYIRGNRRPDGTCCLAVPGYSGMIIADPEGREAWYDALYVQAERPYGVGGAKWGFSFTYTLGQAEQTGGDQFSLDFPTVADYPRRSHGDRRAPPARAARGSSGCRGTFSRASSRSAPARPTRSPTNRAERRRNCGSGPSQRGTAGPVRLHPARCVGLSKVDLRIEKTFRFADSHQVSLAFKGSTSSATTTSGGYNGFIPTLPAVNANYGKPSTLLDVGRRLQFGLRYAF